MRGRRLLIREAPSLALPLEEVIVGRFWGRGRFSERSASPQTPSPEERLAFGEVQFFWLGSACEVGAGKC